MFGYMRTNQGIFTDSSEVEINGKECIYIKELENKLDQVYHSKSYRLGNAFMKPMKYIQDRIHRNASSGASKKAAMKTVISQLHELYH